jgi:hypothetical protein
MGETLKQGTLPLPDATAKEIVDRLKLKDKALDEEMANIGKTRPTDKHCHLTVNGKICQGEIIESFERTPDPVFSGDTVFGGVLSREEDSFQKQQRIAKERARWKHFGYHCERCGVAYGKLPEG